MLARHAARSAAQLRSSALQRTAVASRTAAAARTARRFCATKPAAAAEPAGEPVVLSFVEDGEEVAVTAAVGQTLLEVAHENDIDLEGACDGSLACSTCHVVLEQEYFDMLPEPEEEEEDMLDLAFGLTETSRLGCQIKLTKELEEEIRAQIRNGASDAHVPALIKEVQKIPYTRSGKKVELAVRALFEGQEPKNVGALQDPTAFDEYRAMAADW